MIIFDAPVTFYERADLERTRPAGHVTRFEMAENFCTIFSHSNPSAFVQKTEKINEWIEPLQSPKESSSWNLFCHPNTPEDATDFRL